MDRFKEIWHREYLLSLRDSYKDLRQENFVDKINVGDIVLLRNIKPELVKRRQYWSLARVLTVIKGHDGKSWSAAVLKGSADYLSRKREPEVHPISHLYPLELSLTHEYCTSLPTIDNLPEEIDPALDFSNTENSHDDLVDESDLVALELDGVEEPVLRLGTVPLDLVDTLPISPPVQVTRYGRRVVPPRAYNT